ncbi:MAG TPA: FlgD immunoglobulin-like domain containing protein, partial [Anaerolineae bacterium]|nr:FlgD immunoglobulin-like domain containing protein [Anaerolineae bacterium]
FSPTLLKFSAPETVQYNFDGSDLEMPVTLSGTAALCVFCVFTKDQAGGPLQNGYLGWHFVNKIDTCLYVSPPTQLDSGKQQIVWNGKDSDGGTVPSGDYTYYLWGFDNVNTKTICTSHMSFRWNEMSIIQIYDDDGSLLDRPVIWEGGTDTGPAEGDPIERIHRKWIIGGDPEDAGLVESCTAFGLADLGSIALLPSDHTMWFKAAQTEGGTVQIKKYKWVPNGTGELQTTWGDEGIFEFALPGGLPSSELHMPITTVDGGSHIFAAYHDYITGAPESELIYVDLEDGTETTRVDLSYWWVKLEDQQQGAQAGGGPSDVINAGDAGPGPMTGLLQLNAHGSCINQLLDPYRDGEIGGDVNDLTLWVNGNGDYVGDHNFEEDSVRPWVCQDYYPGPYKYWCATDLAGFSQFPSYNLGATSFGLYAPDGTGIGRFACAGESSSNKYGHRFIQYGSPYDGMYQDGASTEQGAIWTYLAHDSIMGTITTEVGVDDAAPAAYDVAQNSPNPFNPTTTISFTTAEAGNVAIDVFNVAGQKVDTIVSGFMSAGSHTVTWDASEFSAGVYFYTVKAGEFSKTMKMTLLR